jgi:hypothetical protein
MSMGMGPSGSSRLTPLSAMSLVPVPLEHHSPGSLLRLLTLSLDFGLELELDLAKQKLELPDKPSSIQLESSTTLALPLSSKLGHSRFHVLGSLLYALKLSS